VRKLAALLLVVLAACGGGGDSKSPTAADGAAKEATTTSTTVAGATKEPAVAAGETTTTGAAAAPPTTTAAAAPATASTGPTPLAPGTYRYKQSGHASGGGQSYDSPPEGTMVADAPGEDGTQVMHRYIDPAGEPSDTTIRFGPDGIFILSTVLRQGGQEITCTFDEPLPSPAWPPTVGATSAGHADCDMFTTDVASKITGRLPVTIDGTTYDAFVMETTITTSGQVTSKSTQIDHFVAELRLSAHTESNGSGKFGTFEFSSEGTSDLLSATPS
jgi:hypothetical protein